MQGRAASVFGRAVWCLVLIGLGFLAIMLQMDREARKSLAVARAVPEAFRVYALTPLARTSFAEGDSAQGLAYAEELVARRPVPADGLSLLTRGMIAEGDSQGALAALVQGAQRGWRDNFIQYLVVSSALEADDVDVAGQRVLALWRLGDRGDNLYGLTRALFRKQGGAAALASGVARTDAWGTEFFEWALGSDIPADSLDQLATALTGTGASFNCIRLVGPVRNLAARGQGANAERLWTKLCEQGAAARASGYGFQMHSDAPGPFDWRYAEQAGLLVDQEERTGGISLVFENQTHRPVLLARRIAAMKPGAHRLRLQGPSVNTRPMIVRVECLAGDGGQHRVISTYTSSGVVDFALPSDDCSVQEVALLASHGKGRLDDVIIDSLVP